MTNEQLVARIRAGEDEAENMLALWQQNKRFIYKMAMKYQSYAEIEDLLQEGYLGLCEAVQHYDSEQGVSFITYAAFWIRQVIRRYIDNCCSVVRIPVSAKEEILQYKKIVNEYRKWYGKNPTDLEMRSFLGVSREKLETIKKNALAVNLRSLDECIGGEDEEFTLSDTVASDQNVEDDVIKKLDTNAMTEALWKAVDDLPGKDMAEVLRYSVVLQIIYGFMLHFIYNHFQDYPECHITLFKPDYAHKILLSKTKHIILTRMRLLTARTFGFSVMFD